MLGPKEFRDVLRFLAMDEPALLPGAAANVAAAATGSRKRKFVEVPADITSGAPYKLGASPSWGFADKLQRYPNCMMLPLDVEPSSVVEVPSAVEEPNPFAMTVPSNPLPVMHQDAAAQNNILSIFSPMKNGVSSNVDPTVGGFLTNGVETMPSVPAAAPAPAPKVSTPTASAPAVSTPTVTTPSAVNTPSESAATSHGTTAESTVDANSNNQLAFLDEELPLLPDSDHYNFTDGEQVL